MDLERGSWNVDKIRQYGWDGIEDAPGALMYLDKNVLKIDTEYQRSLSPYTSRRIAAEWSWIACGVIIVAHRENDGYHVIDGQHRVNAARRRSDVDTLPCIVFKIDSVKAEAIGFIDTNSYRKGLSALDKHHAKLVALDENAMFLQREIDKLGLEITKTPRKAGQIACISAVNGALEQRGKKHVIEVLKLCNDVCKDIPISETVFKGLDYIATKLDTSNADLYSRLVKIGGEKLQEEAKRTALYMGTASPMNWAIGMIKAVNSRLRVKYELFSDERRENQLD